MEHATLLLEIGTEELPPKSLATLGESLHDAVVQGLQDYELAHGESRWFATPRRLAVLVDGVAAQAKNREAEVLGPPADRAKDDEGKWTRAAEGFARKHGVSADELQIVDTPKGARLGLQTKSEGAKTQEVIGEILRDAVHRLPIAKRMRWGAGREEFVRPVHWLVAMLGAQTPDVSLLGLPAGNTTFGHRFHGGEPLTLSSPLDYELLLKRDKVIPCFVERREQIRQQVEAQARERGAFAVIDESLLDEVTGLVEWPVALTGSFEERFLEVPREALVSSMKEHQKYFHVVDGDGALLPLFITVANIESEDPAQVIAGNERVIRPRLSDAAFFFDNDKKTPLAERVGELADIVFQQKLGTLEAKSERVASLAAKIAGQTGASAELAERAGRLCKADLVTDMVQEFPDMQGTAGSYYAAHDGEHADVATAIRQHYWPRFAGDQLPQNAVATCVALADRLDTLVGVFGIGQPPTGSRDPFALRRASLAVLRIMVEGGLELDLAQCLQSAVDGYPPGVLAEDTAAATLTYMIERFRAWYEEEAIPVEVFKSVSARNLTRPLDIHRRVHAVHEFSKQPEAEALAAANKRVSNILSKLDETHHFAGVSANLLQEAPEKALYNHLAGLSDNVDQQIAASDYSAALAQLATLRDPVDAFFDGVMVNVDNSELRNNRLNLLKQLRDRFLDVADISLLAAAK